MSPLFPTITGCDWSRAIRLQRMRPNVVRAQIAAKVAALKLSRQPTAQPERGTGAERRADAIHSPSRNGSFIAERAELGNSDTRLPRAASPSGEMAEIQPVESSVMRTPFTAAGNADRKGGGTPRAEVGGGASIP